MHLTLAEEQLLREKYGGNTTEYFYRDLKRLDEGAPLAYLIGNAPFLGCTIDLEHRPFIPRSETEYWVSNTLNNLQEISKNKKVSVLDAFSGSGCIGVAIARHIPNSKITFLENNEIFCKQIYKNCDLNAVLKQSTIICESALPNSLYDAVYANPPYISEAKCETVDESVFNWEPHEALFAKDDGFYYINKLIDKFKKLLKMGGAMYIEIGSCQKRALEKHLLQHGISSYEFIRDQYSRWRVLRLVYEK